MYGGAKGLVVRYYAPRRRAGKSYTPALQKIADAHKVSAAQARNPT
jgi:hypothetical protein